ncbi:HAMP domain-containing sensor histidine kinase [Limnohabitans radicicola]|uniref:histidine kinase n=1 Tax=Limnohabitans radicicola TaxID=2771427 RepID=A0A927FEG4_9BURK|nr:HAMP domain-containing sensor histidine kinase [Limnohabitans radicicola]MBD8049914.1 HAMP domain-containing histidine kinase [Limnohabitans radicicola]
MWLKAVSRHLYLRIWLAVVVGVAVLMLVVGWAWRVSVEHNTQPPMPRDWVVMTPQGEVLGTSAPRREPGTPLHFDFKLPNGHPVQLQMQRQWEDGRPPPRMRREPPWWVTPPYGFFWMLGLIGVAVALGLYPVVRRLTQRLEGLQRGVQLWGDGDLSVRVPVQGNDEVADLSQRFNAAATRIEGLMAAQKSLLANASHELRSPLARIRMGLELIDVPEVEESARQRTRDEILRNMAELDQLIDEILLASRLDAREADLGTVEPVDLVGLCAEECARVGAVLDVPEGLHALEVQGVGKLLRRMVRNLLENARRYGDISGAGDAMVLSLVQAPSGIQLRVCDRGPGVPAQWRERIFEPFFRLPGASERVGGVGLGLSLVKSIAERHSASVRCEDRDGGGACFSVHFHPREKMGFAKAP